MKLQITASYFVVFDANAIRLGSIGPQLSEDVAHFYLLVKSLVEDAKQGPSEPIDKAIGEYMLREQIELLEHVLQLGGQLKERLKADANRGFMSKP